MLFIASMNCYSEESWLQWIDQLSVDDYVVIDEFLSEDLYAGICGFLREKLQEEGFVKAGMGSLFNNQVNSSIRGDYTYWLDKQRDESISDFFRLVEELMTMLNRYCYLSLSGYEFHYAYYPPGTFYKKHLDQFKDRNNRMISIIFYLNDNWKEGDGGELRIFSGKNGEVTVSPVARRCVIFRSDTVEHEVLSTKIDRFSVTGWLLYQPSALGYLLT